MTESWQIMCKWLFQNLSKAESKFEKLEATARYEKSDQKASVQCVSTEYVAKAIS